MAFLLRKSELENSKDENAADKLLEISPFVLDKMGATKENRPIRNAALPPSSSKRARISSSKLPCDKSSEYGSVSNFFENESECAADMDVGSHLETEDYFVDDSGHLG